MKVLFLAPYPLDSAGSQRFRFEQYFRFLHSEGVEYEFQSFLTEGGWEVLYKKGMFLRKFSAMLLGFAKRLMVLAKAHNYDLIFVHREIAPVGPPIFEWVIAKVFRKKMVFDFDDAIWLPNTSAENILVSGFKFHSKTSRICSWASCVSAGNEYLAAFARKYNNCVIVNPTTIDTNHHLSKGPNNNTIPIIGWTGTHSTAKYLIHIKDVLVELATRARFKFMYICDKPPSEDFINIEFVRWSRATEIRDLDRIDIGIMPLTDDEWAKGKCGFKAIQYMAMGKATVASPVGVNNDIIRHGVNGFLCATKEEWLTALNELLINWELRLEYGKQGRKTVEQRYSTSSNRQNFLGILKS